MNHNVLVITTHDLGRHLGCYGQTGLSTPRLDRFFGEGVRVEQAFCTAPQCSPSRATMFTGLWPQQNGVMGLCNPGMGWDLRPGTRHLAHEFRDAGAHTFACGIIHETQSPAASLGFASHRRENACRTILPEVEALLNEALATGKGFYGQIGLFEPHRLPATGWQDKEIDQGFLRTGEAPSDPAKVRVPTYLRDTPGTRQELAELQAAVEALDASVGGILDALEARRLSENTLVVFTTDHGLALPRAKCTLYDPGLEIALGLRWPGHVPSGVCAQGLFSNIDFAPTLLDLCGLPKPAHHRGQSRRAQLCEGADGADAVFAGMTFHDQYFPMRAIRTTRHKLIVHFSNSQAFMDCSQSWRPRSDVRTPANPTRSQSPLLELYDLEADPWEQDNRAADPALAQVRADLLRRLADWMVAEKDPLPAQGFPSPRHREACALLGLQTSI